MKKTELPTIYTIKITAETLEEGQRYEEGDFHLTVAKPSHVREFDKDPEAFLQRLLENAGKEVREVIIKKLKMCPNRSKERKFECKGTFIHLTYPVAVKSRWILVFEDCKEIPEIFQLP